MVPPSLVTADGAALTFGGRTSHVMAVVNLSLESRVRHSVVATPEDALRRARACRAAGASLIDLGAQSSHFENRALRPDEEWDRMAESLRLLVEDGFVVSVDTWKPEVASRALDAGAAIVNDTGGLQDDRMLSTIAAHRAPAVLMHIEGRNPLEVVDRELTEDRPARVAAALAARVGELRAVGVEQLVVDPGLSINYRSDYESYGRLQLRTLRALDGLRAAGCPVLVPVPRKAELHRMVAYLTLSIEAGADILRVHDVEIACDLVTLLGRELGTVTRS